jgi:DNA invertase Pin-like site-specific DNA recombinase
MAPRKTTTRRILRAIIYVRVSSYDVTADEAANQSPEVQRARCLARIKAEGWELATDIGDGGILEDLNVSGSAKGDRLDRPGLLACREAIRSRRADVIVALRLDRLARNTVDLLMLADELDTHGGAFALAEGDINTAGPYGKLILTIIAAIAEMEAKMITARTMAGKVAAREQGRWIGTRYVPFGYVKAAHPTIKDAWTLAPDTAAAATVAECVRRVLAGESALSVAKWLNASEVRTQTGQIGRWTATTVREVLTHEAMIGRHYWQGDVLRDDKGMPRTVFPPLVTEDVWRVMLGKLGNPKRNRADVAPAPRRASTWDGSRAARYMLSGGAARCGTCGGPLVVGPDNQGRRRYRCDRRGKGTCAHGVSIRVEDLDSIVAARFLALAGDLRYSEMSIVEERPDTARRADLADALRVARAALADAVEAEDEAAEAAARAQVRTLRAALDDLPADMTMRRERTWSSETYGETFAKLDTAGRRELLAHVVTVTVGPAVERTKTGQYDNSPEAQGRRVTTAWADWLETAAVDALDLGDAA